MIDISYSFLIVFITVFLVIFSFAILDYSVKINTRIYNKRKLQETKDSYDNT